jgi:hypothetical protein
MHPGTANVVRVPAVLAGCLPLTFLPAISKCGEGSFATPPPRARAAGLPMLAR